MHCFAKENRLLAKSDYDHVFAQSKKLVTSDFVLLYCENTVGHARLGLALSKRIIAKAHQRNRVKRILRESFRTHSLPSIDIVILARTGVAKVQNPVIVTRLNKAWDRLCGK